MNRSPTIPLSAFIAITVIIGGFFWIKGPLESKRPAPADRGERASFGAEDVEARLWQDPFAAIHEHLEDAGHATHTAADERHDLAALRAQVATRSSLVVMPVMIPGGDYAEDVEQRRRTRKAVVAALGVAGYVPDDAGHVGYVTTEWLLDPSTDDDPKLPANAEEPQNASFGVIIPHEWFSWGKHEFSDKGRAEDASEDILVVWLDESLMGSRVIAMLDQILDELLADTSTSLTEVSVIGPSSSTTVLGLMRQGAEAIAAGRAPRAAPHPLTFYSCRSTAAEDLLLEELGIADENVVFADTFASLVGAGFIRSVATDRTVIGTLFTELERRGVAPRDPELQVVLVGEWDTFYGRAIPRSFRGKMSERGIAGRLHQFSYLKGLDGILPGAEKAATATGGRGGGAATTSTAFVPRPDDVAWPFGRNQLDNIQRLTVHLQRLEDSLARQRSHWRLPFKHGIDVIGVVGSDIYDKLLILQALTHRFPNAVFFTTDLDAQMLHPTQQSWSRNVIVVSSYGLSLSDEWQGYTLPFRDSYQTATYVAALQAVQVIPADQPLEPRVFEIGRQQLVDLSPSSASGIHPPFAEAGLRFGAAWPRAGLIVVALATMMATILAFLFYRSVQRIAAGDDPPTDDQCHVTPTMVGVTGGALLVGFIAMYATSVRLWNAGGHEPVSAFGGVSAWPIQYWRWTVLVFSVAFFFYAGRVLRAHVRRVEERFGLGDEATTELATRKTPYLADTLEHWQRYKRDGSRRSRARRVVLGLGIFAVFMAGLYLIYGLPPAPFRGRPIAWLHWPMLLASGVGAASVTLFVLDAILLCWRRILTLAPAESGWPSRIVQAFRNRLEVPERVTEPLNQVLDLEIIGDTTRVVGNLLRWPFVLLLLMILSRNTLHESWTLTPTLLYTYGALFTLALISAIGLRTQAARARNHVRNNLRDWRCGIASDPAELAMQAHGGDLPAGGDQDATVDCSWIDRVSDHVESMDKGAYAPWYRHPIIQSVLLPASGLVLITVTELIARSGP